MHTEEQFIYECAECDVQYPPTMYGTKKLEKLLSAGYNFKLTVGDCEKSSRNISENNFQMFWRTKQKHFAVSAWQLNSKLRV